MIKTRKDLTLCLDEEKKWYFRDASLYSRIKSRLLGENRVLLFRYVRFLRYAEYYHNRVGILSKILHAYWQRKKNRLGRKLGIEIRENSFGPGLHIYHCGNIVVNSLAKIGRDCALRGDNCIGNTGKSQECPVIGDRVQLGFGAKVIGNVTIADDIIIAAGAVVVDSFYERGVTIGGIPAKVIG